MKVILFDTETTDLVHNTGLPLHLQPRIVEIYAKKIELPSDAFGSVDEWNDLGEIEFIVNPGVPIPEESSNITGIDDEMVKNLKPISTYWDEISDFFRDANCVVAHNLAYDAQLMEFEQRRINLKNPEKVFQFPDRKLCTVESTIHLKGFRLSLQALYEHLFGENFDEAHRAKNDVIALERCFKKLYEDGEI
jgi:DNA polymerase III epsilon subunit-like protein